MLNRSSRSTWLGKASVVGMLVLAGAVLPSVATGATGPTPESATSCNGSLKKAPTSGEPYNLAYKFHCDWGITAYTLVVNRGDNDSNTVDDFSPNALVYEPTGEASSKESFSCSGDIPGDGVNCNAGGGYMTAPYYAEGTFDLTAPYCPTATKATKATKSKSKSKSSTVTATSRALVQLVVSDTTGAEDGPFTLKLSSGCKVKHKTKHGKKKAATRRA